MEALAVRPTQGAAMLGVSRALLFRWLACGEIPSFKAHGTNVRLIAVADLRRWVDAQRVEAKPTEARH